jgi:hypothetical protein
MGHFAEEAQDHGLPQPGRQVLDRVADARAQLSAQERFLRGVRVRLRLRSGSVRLAEAVQDPRAPLTLAVEIHADRVGQTQQPGANVDEVAGLTRQELARL